MVLADDIMHGRDPSDYMRPQLQAKKTEVKLHQPLIKQQMASHALHIIPTRQSMALAIDIIHWYSPSNEMRPKLQPKKTTAKLY